MSVVTATYVLCAIFACGGVFSIAAGVGGWDWFFNSGNVRLLTGGIPRRYARLLYVLIGIAIIGMAVYLYHSVNAQMR
ncbi:MAG: immunity 17 family protein [Bacteroides sp.]|nr:immunity 17 family protein [Bacteroides sp.]MCM1390558.1 immunity 17 family protein [Bacteroides sp.]